MLKKMLLGCVAVCVFSTAQADIVSYSDRASFEAAGSIAYHNDFETWDTSSGFALPGDPFTEQGVTYDSGANLIVGVESGYTLDSNHLGNNNFGPISGVLNALGEFNMFGFNYGASEFPELFLTLTSNLTSYEFDLSVAPDPSVESLWFVGFALSAGEYFTSFTLTPFGDFLVLMDDVSLGSVASLSPVTGPEGNTVTVPEPAGLLLFGLALAGLCLTRKRQAH